MTKTVVQTETKKLFLKNVNAPLVPKTSWKFFRVHVLGNKGGVDVKISVRSLNDIVRVQKIGKTNMTANTNSNNLKITLCIFSFIVHLLSSHSVGAIFFVIFINKKVNTMISANNRNEAADASPTFRYLNPVS